MARNGDLYDVLGVAKDATAQDIKKAFRQRARECHPDVAGSDPAKAEAFKRLREAYEVLADPEQRARYDRRSEPRTGGPFYGSMWNRAGAPSGAGPTARTRAAGNDLDLEDIFNDFSGVGDFGFTGNARGQPGGRFKGGGAAARPGAGPGGPGPAGGRPGGPRPGGPRPSDARSADPRASEGRPSGPPGGSARGDGAAPPPREPRRGPVPGRDIPVVVDVPPQVARDGGTVTVGYVRLRRADDGHTLYRYDELHDVKVPPGTRHGDTLRVERLGDAGLEGGSYGDLVADVRVGGAADRGPRAGWDPEVEGRRGSDGGRAAGGPEGRGGGAPPRNAPPGGQGPLDPRGDEPGDPLGAGPPEDEEPAPRRRPPDGMRARAWSAEGWSRRDDGAPREAPRSATDASGAPRGAPGGAGGPGRMRMPGAEPSATADGALRVDVGVVTALLGGRITVPTPAGPVRVNLPAGTSSGTRMRLRGRGPAGPDGVATDLVAEVRIVVPKALDEASRALIEQFAARNPEPDEGG